MLPKLSTMAATRDSRVLLGENCIFPLPGFFSTFERWKGPEDGKSSGSFLVKTYLGFQK